MPHEVEEATQTALTEIGEVSPAMKSLAQVALNLARKLDSDAGLATAAVARELRAIMTQLAKDAEQDDDNDEGDALLEALQEPLSADLCHAANL